MPLVLLLLSFLASLIVLVANGYALLRLFRWLEIPLSARVPMAAILGFAVMCNLTALVGMTVGWNPWLWGLLAACLAAAMFGVAPALRDGMAIVSGIQSWWKESPIVERVFLVVACVAMLMNIIHVYLPPAESDSIMFYLRDAQLLLPDGRLRPTEYERLSYYPMNRQVLSVLGYFLWGYPLARLFSLIITLVIVASLVAFTRQLFAIDHAIMSIAVVAMFPISASMSTTGKVYPLLALFLLGTILALELVRSVRVRRGLFFVAGLFFGCALGTQSTALLYGPFVMIWFVRGFVLSRTDADSSVREFFQATLLFIVGATVAYAPWSIWGWRYFDSPFHPFITTNTGGNSGSRLILSAFSQPSMLWDRLLEAMVRVGRLAVFEAIPVLVWIFLVVGIAGSIRNRRTWLLTGCAVGSFLVFSLVTLQMPHLFAARFVIVGTMLLVPVAGVGVVMITRSERQFVRWGIGGVLALVTMIFSMRPVLFGFTSAKVVLGLESPEAFERKYIGSYDVIKWARSNWTWGDRVWSVDVHELIYFDAGVFLTYSSPLGRIVDRPPFTAYSRCVALDSLGVSYVLTGPDASRVLERHSNFKIEEQSLASLVETCLDTVFVSSDSSYTVYRRRASREGPVRTYRPDG